MAAADIDDAEAAHAKRGAVAHEDAFVIGTAMPDDIAHLVDAQSCGLRVTRISINEARNTAHLDDPFLDGCAAAGRRTGRENSRFEHAWIPQSGAAA